MGACAQMLFMEGTACADSLLLSAGHCTLKVSIQTLNPKPQTLRILFSTQYLMLYFGP